MWARLQVALLALSAMCRADSFELQLRPDSIVDGVPQGFTFSLVNTSSHDVRVPTPTNREKLRAAGIDFPQVKLASGHIAFRKAP